MDRIKNSEPGKTRVYFGYSSVLDEEAFDIWKGEHGYNAFCLPTGQPAQLLDYALDFNFPSRWWGGRAAGLIQKPGSIVHGIAFEIRSEDWPIIQHKEGHVTNMSIEIPVITSVGSATAFTTAPARVSNQGPVSIRFLEAWEKGARFRNLPSDYIESIKSCM